MSPAARPRRQDLDDALAFRAALRELLHAGGDGPSAEAGLERLNVLARGAAIETRLEPSGPRFVSADEASVRGAIGVLLAIVATAMIDGSWARMRICPGHECGWAFYDQSRNQTGRWCSMSVCGGRSKARAHYRRRRRPDGFERGDAGPGGRA
jgi:predicted RNA-binding Zn ribbon-like protein